MTKEEAIRRIKAWNLDSDDTEVLATVIPELRESESEDEKIRKSLIKDFRNYYEMYDKSCGEPKWGSDYLLVKDILAWFEKQKEQKPIKMGVYEIGKETTICGQDYKCKKDYKEGNCWYIKDVIYHCSRDGYLYDQNGLSWSCTPEWFNEYIYSNTELAEEEKNRFVSGQFLQCKLSFDGFKEGEHYWLEYVGDDIYVGRSDNILNQKFHITPRQLYALFSQELDEKQKEQKPIPKFKVGDRIYDKRDSYNRNVIREVGKDYYINAFAQKMDMTYTDANFEFIEHLDNETPASKPAEWSKNDTVFLNEITDFFENKTVRLQHDLDMYAHWLKSLPKRFNLQPKQEWSEEDAKFDTREPRDNWEYIKEFYDKFGRMPKDIDELDVLVSYVMDKKQKEQKPILKFKVGDKIHLINGTSPNYEDDCITIREIGTINYIGEFKKGYVPIKEQDKWELVKEQKPAECTPDSVLQKIKSAITDYKKLSEHYKDTKENFYQYYGGKADGLRLALIYYGNENEQLMEEYAPDSAKFDEGFKTGREVGYREGVESVKPAEWSEEDEVILKDIKFNFEYNKENMTPALQEEYDKFFAKIKSLRPQKSVVKQEMSEKHIADIFEKVGLAKIVREQGNDELTNAVQDAMLELSKMENTAWSKEDEKMRLEAIKRIDELEFLGIPCNNVRKVLEFLRPYPSWKPSEEQMNALKLAYEDAFECTESCVPHFHLKSLYNDLKKLM